MTKRKPTKTIGHNFEYKGPTELESQCGQVEIKDEDHNVYINGKKCTPEQVKTILKHFKMIP